VSSGYLNQPRIRNRVRCPRQQVATLIGRQTDRGRMRSVR
jgi:hypothetical protein